MKKQIVSLLVLLLATSGFFYSCTNPTSKHIGSLEFDSIQANRTEHLFNDTAKPACELSIKLEFVKKAERKSMMDSLNSMITAWVFGDSYQTLTPQEAIKQYADKYTSDYRADLEPTFEAEQHNEDIGAWYSYYKYMDGSVNYYGKNWLTYQYHYEEFTGGAHGINMSSFLNINLKTMTPIHLDDLFASGYEEALTDLLWNQLMADNKATSRQELEDQGYSSTGELAPTENFALSQEGITFFYNVYDIAPYVMGATLITLPWEMVQHLRKDTTDLP